MISIVEDSISENHCPMTQSYIECSGLECFYFGPPCTVNLSENYFAEFFCLFPHVQGPSNLRRV